MLLKLNSSWNVRISEPSNLSYAHTNCPVCTGEVAVTLRMGEAELRVSISNLHNTLDRVAWISVVRNEHNAYNMEVTFSPERPSFDQDVVELIKLEAEPSREEAEPFQSGGIIS
ncbi:hypothetical protein PoB_001617900 [Plakobranchus ocellatus]|uniref:Uncharacterized protein n=1 Tax=Plakobranchus ocellatus TaxID=259542 RepID=A0AAV3Z5K4_9GAST|nr:hypothetical protein PoB_001617900 [Plakobranchus ocellatus]